MRKVWKLVSIHLSRKSTSGNFIPELDGLRFIAINSVIFYHLNGYLLKKSNFDGIPGWLSNLLNQGNFGVPLFFVISGFIIAYPFAKRIHSGDTIPSLKRYYTRRLTRLEPPYIINLLIVFILLIFVNGLPVSELVPHLMASSVYMHNEIFGEMSQINFVAWSLEIEFQFYIMAPLLVLVFRIRSTFWRRNILIVAIGFLTVLSSNYFRFEPRLALSILNYAQWFLLGFLLTDIYIIGWHERAITCWQWDAISILIWPSIPYILMLGHEWEYLLPFMVMMVYIGAFRGVIFQWFFSRPLIFTIGGMCYTIYLYHFYIISIIGRFALKFFQPELPFWANLAGLMVLLLPIIIIISAVIFIITERPFMSHGWHRKVLIHWRINKIK